MTALAINTFCRDLSPILKLIGDLINIFKISLPILLIGLSIFDIGKAITSAKPDEIKKNIKNSFRRLLVSISIFFVPTICMVILGFVGSFQEIKDNSGLDYDVCYECMFASKSDKCESAVELAELSK